jgi:hypothetical protein
MLAVNRSSKFASVAGGGGVAAFGIQKIGTLNAFSPGSPYAAGLTRFGSRWIPPADSSS